MSLWNRSGARAGGICGSPVSSEDEGDVFAYDDKENDRPNASRASKKTASGGPKPKQPRVSNAVAAPLKRRRGADMSAGNTETQPPKKVPRVLSKKELVRSASQRFVEYLADQLSPATQAQFCEEFGFGQGFMMRPPTSWNELRERREFGDWAQQLGFVASKVHRNLYRISSLNVDIVMAELRTRVRIRCSDSLPFPADSDVSMNYDVEAEPEPRPDELPKPALTKKEDAVSLQTVKEHFQRLDQEELEMLSVSEHDRLLSTIRHEQIADAMEEVLARPSVRKDRDRARRMSKLGRIAERRLSLIPMRQSIMPSTIMEDAEWEDDEDEESEGEEEKVPLQESGAILEEDEEDESIGEAAAQQLGDGIQETASSVDEVDIMVTPRKSMPTLRPRRSSIGSVTTTPRRNSVEPTLATPRSSSIGSATKAGMTPQRTSARKASLTPMKTPQQAALRCSMATPLAQTPLTTPQKVQLRTPMKTPMRTPKKTPKRTPRRTSISAFGPRRSSITKATLGDLKRWKVVGRNILGAVFRAGFLGIDDLKSSFNVSKIWREVSIPAYAWAMADYSKQTNVLTIEQVYADCPRGHYLSDGAYKEVFKVFSTRYKRLEAVSVMDVRAIENTGNQHIVRQEVAHSLLLSELVRSRFSPHFVEIYDVFLARERPQTMRWGSAACRKPVDLLTGSRNLVDASLLPRDEVASPDGLFQYIRMEFCDGGDIEDFIGLQDNKLLPVTSVVLPFFFQMVFSLYSARERFQMRHCDIKLLNFFLKDISRKGLKCAEDEPLTLQYAIGDDAFNVQTPATFSYWVKLADYGTADSNVENLGKPVSLDQFTTLENTPIEFLLEGDLAQQSFAADTFSLGLCLLHLFTGSAPYEEILESVKCPAPLLQDLKKLWLSAKKNSSFSVLRRVGQDDSEDVLLHTLYRYIVLFGLPVENPSASKRVDLVWNLLIKHLRPEDVKGSQPARQSSRRAAAASKKPQPKSASEQFKEDQAEFSVADGSHAIIQRARERMARVPGAQQLLLSLVAFNPSERPTMKQTLFSQVFHAMRVTPSAGNDLPRPVHYTIDCYSSDKIAVDRLPDV